METNARMKLMWKKRQSVRLGPMELAELANAFVLLETQDAKVYPRPSERRNDAQKMEPQEMGTGLQQKETMLQEKELLVVH